MSLLEKTEREQRRRTLLMSWLPPALLTGVLLIVLGQLVTPYMLLATLSYTLMFWGVIFRKLRAVHVGLMVSAIFIDLTLVLVLQFQREAIQTAVSLSLDVWQQLHVGASTLATALYIPVLILGSKLLFAEKRSLKLRAWHIKLGWSAFIFRTLGFILMFSLLSHVEPLP